MASIMSRKDVSGKKNVLISKIIIVAKEQGLAALIRKAINKGRRTFFDNVSNCGVKSN